MVFNKKQPEDNHHITRQCPKRLYDGNRLSIAFFKLRFNDAGKLSCNWCEYHRNIDSKWDDFFNCDMQKILKDILLRREIKLSDVLPVIQIQNIKLIFNCQNIYVTCEDDKTSYSHVHGIPYFDENEVDLLNRYGKLLNNYVVIIRVKDIPDAANIISFKHH
jgi:hypothetical protein